MGISSDKSVNQRIIDMRKDKARILTIHNWMMGWDSYKQLDEQVVLAQILNVLDKAQLAVSRKEVRTCFDKYYNKGFHGERLGYLQWLYTTFNIKYGTIVESSQARAQPSQKQPLTGYQKPLNTPTTTLNENVGQSTTGVKNG